MRTAITSAICLIGVAMASTTSAFAHGVFKKALVEHYGFGNSTSISCYACHAKKDDVPIAQWNAAKDKKVFRNDFGKRIEKILEGKNITANLKAAKEKAAESEDEADEIKASADAEATKIFMEAFREFEVQKAPAGPTWKALITKGEIEGIKP